jgi:nucleotide-binding universal stress UspA family protein
MGDAPIVVGYDGSQESQAAADWAVCEAERRRAPVELLYAGDPPASRSDSDEQRRLSHLTAAREAELRALRPDIEVTTVHVPRAPVAALESAAGRAEMLVLGSRGLGALHGFVVGSVSQEVLVRGACPMVLVRAVEPQAAGVGAAGALGCGTSGRDVVVGLDMRHPVEAVLGFAFQAADLRAAPLHVMHAWGLPPGGEYMAYGTFGAFDEDEATKEGQRLEATLVPWRRRYPQVRLRTTLARGNASVRLVDAGADAQLLVVGRHHRRLPMGRLGPVTSAAIHHIGCPVAVVPCD